ncbi:hypothetical protein AMS68_004823 [Peltaster fructicola]|uniref:deoxyribose-phosphate aldolase n=1 Tax=Peltaster fructicola TaxID=286661 RepID=A0A6H0XX99_9PEZI|nr:hypothetical protein AMS68_004823 [Peltaster fructicola]
MSSHRSVPSTDEQWKQLIDAASRAMKVSNEPRALPTSAISKTLDHTLLKLDATPSQIDALCEEARDVDPEKTVCVRPNYVSRCVANLKGTDVKVASVIGFHEGTYDTAYKLKETSESLQGGATELDVVINWPQIKSSHYNDIYHELHAIREAAPRPTLLKLIFETSQLEDSEIVAACVLASSADFDYVKTSTGFLGHGAKIEHVQLMSAACDHLGGSKKMLVKASGGVRSLQDALTMLRAGASRLGTSAGVAIATQANIADAQAHTGAAENTHESSTEY